MADDKKSFLKGSGKKASDDSEAVEVKAEVKSASAFDLEKKIKDIEASALPDAEKKAYIERLKGKAAPSGDRVPFSVYANLKKIRADIRAGMLAYPGASVKAATIAEWDEIFKSF